MKEQKQSLYRSSKQPSIVLPFGVRSVGYYQVSKNYSERPMIKNFVQLFWGVNGNGEFIIKNKRYILYPHHVLIYFPGDEHRIKSISSTWEYRWFTMDGSMNFDIVKAFGLNRQPVSVGPCPEGLFQKLKVDIEDITPHGERTACVTAFNILALAAGQNSIETPHDFIIQKSVTIIEKRYIDAFFGVKVLARSIGIHRSLLCRLFKQKMGITPVKYLISLRIQKALSLLKETDLRISEIAYRVGYNDPNYFTKEIRRTTGISPREFRSQ